MLLVMRGLLQEIGKGIYGGYKGRIGLLCPASNVIAEPDFTRMALAGVSIQTARVSETGGAIWSPDSKSELAFMKNALSDSAAQLVPAIVDVMVYACTIGSLL